MFTYPCLVDHIDNDDQFAPVGAIGHIGHAAGFNETAERLKRKKEILVTPKYIYAGSETLS